MENIHSADFVGAFDAFFRNPRSGEVYNIGGARHANCSMVEAIAICEELTGRPMNWTYADDDLRHPRDARGNLRGDARARRRGGLIHVLFSATNSPR
jgi:nucleoside-diphosphate-sugar epimerase